jgi:hypothetical protein
VSDISDKLSGVADTIDKIAQALKILIEQLGKAKDEIDVLKQSSKPPKK